QPHSQPPDAAPAGHPSARGRRLHQRRHRRTAAVGGEIHSKSVERHLSAAGHRSVQLRHPAPGDGGPGVSQGDGPDFPAGAQPERQRHPEPRGAGRAANRLMLTAGPSRGSPRAIRRSTSPRPWPKAARPFRVSLTTGNVESRKPGAGPGEVPAPASIVARSERRPQRAPGQDASKEDSVYEAPSKQDSSKGDPQAAL